MIIIRSATIADVSQLMALFQEEIAHQRQLTPFFDLVPHVDWKRFTLAKLHNRHERVTVAEQEGHLVGYIDVRVPRARRPWVLTQLSKRLRWRNKTPSIVQ